MKILCLGDSITFGYGVPAEQTWTALTTAQSQFECINRGISGNTTGGMLAQLEHTVTELHPDAVLLMGGANDIMLSGTAAQAQSNMGAMGHITAARGLIPLIGVAPSACPPIQPGWEGLIDFDRSITMAKQYGRWLSLMCDTFRYPCIDFGLGLTELAEQARRPLHEYYLDGLHMNAEGHKAMAQILCHTLRKLKL